MSTTTADPAPVRRHKRDVRWKIVAPVVISAISVLAIGVVLILAVATGSLVFKQVTVVSCAWASCYFAAAGPAVLCHTFCSRAGDWRRKGVWSPVRSSGPRHFTERVTARTHRTMPRLARPLIALNQRLSRWEHTPMGWQRSSLEQERTSL